MGPLRVVVGHLTMGEKCKYMAWVGYVDQRDPTGAFESPRLDEIEASVRRCLGITPTKLGLILDT